MCNLYPPRRDGKTVDLDKPRKPILSSVFQTLPASICPLKRKTKHQDYLSFPVIIHLGRGLRVWREANAHVVVLSQPQDAFAEAVASAVQRLRALENADAVSNASGVSLCFGVFFSFFPNSRHAHRAVLFSRSAAGARRRLRSAAPRHRPSRAAPLILERLFFFFHDDDSSTEKNVLGARARARALFRRPRRRACSSPARAHPRSSPASRPRSPPPGRHHRFERHSSPGARS